MNEKKYCDEGKYAAPRWLVYPQYSAITMGWRMGAGEDYRITNFEMESSPLAGLAAQLGHNACTVCCIIANRYLQSSNPDYKPAIRKLVELCVDRMSTL